MKRRKWVVDDKWKRVSFVDNLRSVWGVTMVVVVVLTSGSGGVGDGGGRLLVRWFNEEGGGLVTEATNKPAIMATLSPFYLRSTPSPVTVSSEYHFSVGIFRPENSLRFRTPNFRSKTLRLHSSSSSNGKTEEDESESSSRRFLDEDGVVEDMDGYLNYLSLEYDSVWDTKPSWCQPWTITLTGASVVAGSWLILHNILATSLASILIGTWWYIFLYSYPKAYTEMIAERRKKVTSGVEDTFGLRNSP
ncbi:hypothetical protein QVD17_03069 [Tagetes erecta]|uniref:DUF6737 domain-containing protein n=1 Tax=Tagetes erecta TaxID=13708 RepID=A0AAD8L7Q6_TARER|nr:hypothetical protein QVD17_03069 [Tagetes erecta]